jgi:hypothetical protein
MRGDLDLEDQVNQPGDGFFCSLICRIQRFNAALPVKGVKSRS